jgi:hypothetical protein
MGNCRRIGSVATDSASKAAIAIGRSDCHSRVLQSPASTDVWSIRYVTETQVRADTFDLAIATARRNGAVAIVACMQDD